MDQPLTAAEFDPSRDLITEHGKRAANHQRLLEGLRGRLLTCVAEQFGFDGSANFAAATPEGQLNQVGL